MSPAARADENGEYELRPVSPGEMWLYAIAPNQRPDSKYGLVRYTKARLTLAADSVTTWDPVLTDGRVIEGRALYSDGVAITEVFVTLQGPSKDEERVAYTEDGSFRFLNLGPGPYSVRVQMWTRPEGALEPFVEGVFPDGPPVDVVAAFESPREFEPSTVRVRLVDETKLERGEGTVVIESAGSLSWRLGEWKGGAWTFRLEEPGVYRAVGLYGERAICTGEDFEVQGGETLDLPDLVAGLGGTLVLQIERPEDPVPTGLRAFLRRKASKSAEAFELGGEIEMRIDNLEPGTGTISFLGSNIRQLALDFEVREGEETHLTVPLTAAVPVLYRVAWPSNEATGTLSIRFIDRRTGAVVDEFDTTDLTAYSSPIRWHSFLPVGSFRFEVTKNGRLHHSEDFEVTSLDPREAPKLGLQ